MKIKPGQHWTGIDKCGLKMDGWPIEFRIIKILEKDEFEVIGDPNLRGFGKDNTHYKMQRYFIPSAYILVNSRLQILKHEILDCLRVINPFKRKAGNRKT